MATSSPHFLDLRRSLVALDQNSTIIAGIELSQSSWLVGGVLPGIERQPRKKAGAEPRTAAWPAASLAG
jgi:transposase